MQILNTKYNQLIHYYVLQLYIWRNQLSVHKVVKTKNPAFTAVLILPHTKLL